MKSASSSKALIVDSFVPGKKMKICHHQLIIDGNREDCEYQFPAGDGAFLICTLFNGKNPNKCILEENENRK